MEFDLSKENIQPLRGGRNVTQLGVALQAQSEPELQRELMQQKRTFEEAIRTYEGEDPIENWYNYIYWVEQSYPKHGHEGNLIPVLEDCLSKFENDERYIHDRRLCKLWIKYIDLQQNPLELFQLLYSKSICVTCADLYRAWAFYHEISGDYKRADAVYKLGLKAMAQPFEELSYAHQNMFTIIGREAVEGRDERRREEERHALTSLVSYTHNQRTVVPSVRIGSNVLNATPGALPNTSHTSHQERSNAPITLYEDLGVAGPSIGANASVSVVEVARKQEVIHKENTLKPGTWKKSIITKKVLQPKQPAFKVHEDEDPQYAGGIRLPPDFAPMNFDDFSTWKTDLFYPEPEDDTKIPMYPKHFVYGTPGIEYSPEEIRARKWFAKKHAELEVKNDSCMTMQETMMEDANIMAGNPHRMNAEIEQAVQSILPSTSVANTELGVNFPQTNESFVVPRMSLVPQNISDYDVDTSPVELGSIPEPSHYQPRASVYQPVSQDVSHHMSQAHGSQNASYYHGQVAHTSMNNSKVLQASNSSQMYSQHHSGSQPQHWIEDNACAAAPIQQWPNNTVNCDDNYTQHMREAMKSVNDIWKDSLSVMHEPSILQPVQKPEINKFQIHEDTVLTERQTQAVRAVENTSSSSKLHFSIYDDSEADTKRVPQPNLGPGGNPTMGYRKPARDSLREPFASQPLPEPEHELPRKTPSYSEPLNDENNFVRPADVKPGFTVFEDNATGVSAPNMNDSCTTQQFNFFLKSAQVSTPFNYKKAAAQQYSSTFPGNQDAPKVNSKKLFEENEIQPEETATHQNVLSVILETTKEYRNNSSSGSSSNSANMLKTTTFYRESLKAIPESSHTYEETMHSKVQDEPQQISNNVSVKEVNDYNMVRMLLKNDSPDQNRKSCVTPTTISPMKNFIDLTGDDSVMPRQSVYRVSEIGGGDAMQNQQKIQKTLMTNYESPMKNQFREMSCDSSNDSLSSSPVKGLKMDVDLNSSQKSNSGFVMEHDSEPFDETILQKPPNDPFNNKLVAALLRKVGFPSPKYSNQYFELQSFPRFIGKKEVVAFADNKYMVEKVIGKGAFGSVYKATNLNTQELVALKLQRPANKWEFYITKEIQERCNPHMVTAFMDVTSCYISPAASILVSKFFKFGSLLDLANKVKIATNKCLKEIITIYYAIEIITIVNTLHKCNIIHADIKPDNFLVTRMPPEYGYPSLQLIDFGNSIDMSLFPKGTTFKTVVNTENFICTEMKDGRPWTYQTDIFCIAATVHVLLFDKYMQKFYRYCGLTLGFIQTDTIISTSAKSTNQHFYKIPFSIISAEFERWLVKLTTYTYNCVGLNEDLTVISRHTRFFQILNEMSKHTFPKVQKNGNVWAISEPIRRYLSQDLWRTFFFQMLNIESCDKLPDLDQIKASFNSIVSARSEDLQMEMRLLANKVLAK